MKPVYHTVISVAISGILHLIFRSWGLTIASLISGIFIDLDYAVDYLTQCGFPFKIKRLYQSYYENQLLRVRLFHGWEWSFFWGLTAWMTDWNPWIIGIWVGFSQHIFLDNINNRESFWSYSFFWRWKKGFKPEAIFKQEFYP